MTNTYTGVLPSFSRRIAAEPLWLIVTGIYVVSALLSLVFGWYWTTAPLLLVLVVLVMASPLAGIFVLIAAMFFKTSLPGLYGIYPADIASFLFIISAAVHRLVHGKAVFRRLWSRRAAVIVLAAMAVSLASAYDSVLGLKNWLRHVQLFMVFLAIIACLKKEQVTWVIRWLLFVTAIVSVLNVSTFVLAGGKERVFGITGAFFASFTVLTGLQAAIGFLMTGNGVRRLGWGILFFLYAAALTATQTRAAFIQMFLTLMLIFVIIWLWSRRCGHTEIRYRMLALYSGIALVGLISFFGAIPLLDQPISRINEALAGHAQTVNYRLFLWKTGLKAFAGSPFAGIGLGQISAWDQFIPTWRFDPMAMHTRGLGAHNDSITYLAETGLVGFLALMWFFWRMYRVGASKLHDALTAESAERVLMLWIPVVAIIMGFFFRTHIFYSIAGLLTVLYFALLVVHCESPADTVTE